MLIGGKKYMLIEETQYKLLEENTILQYMCSMNGFSLYTVNIIC